VHTGDKLTLANRLQVLPETEPRVQKKKKSVLLLNVFTTLQYNLQRLTLHHYFGHAKKMAHGNLTLTDAHVMIFTGKGGVSTPVLLPKIGNISPS
jgi:hypothetical protein